MAADLAARSATDLHHGGSAGAFMVVSGELTEAVVTPGGLRAQCCKERAFGPDHVHRIVNDGKLPAVSVHVYGPALKDDAAIPDGK